MKKTIWLIVATETDDHNNIDARVLGIYPAEEEAKKALKGFHDKARKGFVEPIDEYEKGDDMFLIQESIDLAVQTFAIIQKEEIDL